MFKINIEVKDSIDANEFVSLLKKNKEINNKIEKINIPKRKKSAKKMTDYYTPDGKQLSLVEFRRRIKKSEESIRAGKGYSIEQVLQLQKEWKKKHGLT